MKVMMVNGSPHAKGNTFLALDEMRKVFENDGIKVELIQVGHICLCEAVSAVASVLRRANASLMMW